MERELVNLAMSMYAGEPCRICGKLLTMEDINDGAVFAGYDNSSRSAHRLCWENSKRIFAKFANGRKEGSCRNSARTR